MSDERGRDWVVVSRLKEEAVGRRKEASGEGRKEQQFQEGRAICCPHPPPGLVFPFLIMDPFHPHPCSSLYLRQLGSSSNKK